MLLSIDAPLNLSYVVKWLVYCERFSAHLEKIGRGPPPPSTPPVRIVRPLTCALRMGSDDLYIFPQFMMSLFVFILFNYLQLQFWGSFRKQY